MALNVKKIIKLVIIFAVMFLFSSIIQPIEPITKQGMQILGIFIAAIIGWTFIDTVGTTLIIMIALCFVEGYSMPQVVVNTFGNANVMLMLAVFIFIQMIEREQLANWIVNASLSSRLFKGRPMLFSAAILAVANIVGIINNFLSLFLLWEVVYAVCKESGIKPYDKYVATMLVGVALQASLGLITLPFQDSGLILTSSYAQMTGHPINYLTYLAVILVIEIATIAIWILGSRYLLRVDYSRLANVDLTGKKIKATNRQKASMVFCGLIVFLLLFANNGPKDFWFTQILTQIHGFGIFLSVIILASLIHVDGEPMMDIAREAKDGIKWQIMFMVSIIMFFSSQLTAPTTGISPFVVTKVGGLLNGMSPIAVTVLILAVSFVLTNFMNNIIVGSLMISLIVPLSAAINFNLEATATLIIITSSFAILTPPASGTTPFLFGNKDWVTVKDIYTVTVPLMLLSLLFALTVGVALANLIC